MVAFYSPTEEYPFRREIYWRRIDSSDSSSDSSSAVVALDLLSSIQTDLLDSHPAVRVSSSLSAVEVLRMTASTEDRFETIESTAGAKIELRTGDVGCVLIRLPCQADGKSFSYAEMIHPSDLGETSLSITSEGYAKTEHTLMADFLEKGVIRRARLRGVFLDRQADTEAAAYWYRSFVEEKLPLTT